MEPVKNLSLRSFFILTVSAVFGVVVLLSGLVVWGCMACRAYLLPDPEAVYLTVRNVYPDGTENTQSWRMGFGEEETSLPRLSAVEVDANGTEEEKVLQQDLSDTKYSVEKITRSFDTLTPRRKVAYQCCGIAMVVIPGVLSLSGILIGGVFFYRKKLDRPLCLLQEAAGQIADQNLDFSLEYDCRDEMGELCHSFEQMRAALEENNQQMWNLLEQRRFLQASIAHDLRNPLAILQGYTEYLQMNLPGGKLSTEKISRIASHLHVTAGRLAQYTESVRILNRLEDMEVKLEEVTAGEFFGELADDLGMLASGTGKLLCVGGARLGADAGLVWPERELSLQENGVLPGEKLRLDRDMVWRILENVVENALHFARTRVRVDWKKNGSRLCIMVQDDGPGFPEKVLAGKGNHFLPTGREDGHLGMGLAISRLFAGKHGGSLEMWNGSSVPGKEVEGNEDPGKTTLEKPGTVVKIILAV